MSAGNALTALFTVDNSGFNAGMNNSDVVAAKVMESIKRRIEGVNKSVKELQAGQNAANQGASMAKATQEIVNYGKAAEFTAKQISQANRLLPAQMTDIVTSLAGGQNPLLVFIQQGGQIKDMFGGIGGAVAALSSLITPLSVGIGVAAAAVGAIGYAMYESAERAKNFANGVVLTGNAAGFTAASMEAMAVRVQFASNATVGASRDILQALANTGRMGPQEIEKVAVSVLRLSSISGEAADKLVASFANAKDGVLKWALEQNKQMNFMTPAIYAAAKAAEDMGDKSAALGIILDELNPRLAKTASLWERIKNAYAFITPDAVKAFTRPIHPEEALAALQARIAQYQAIPNRDAAENKALEDHQRRARAMIAAIDRSATSEAATIEAARRNAEGLSDRQAVDALIEKGKSYGKLNEEVKKLEETFRRLDATENPYTDAQKKAAMDALRKKFAQPSVPKGQEATGLMPMYSTEEAFNAATTLEVELEAMKAIFKAREEARKSEEQAANDAMRLERISAVEVFKSGGEEFDRNAARAKAKMKELADDGAKNVKFFEDSVMSLVKNGSAGFRDLFATMAEEYLRNIIRMAAQKHLLDQSGAFVGWGQGLMNLASAAGSFFGGTGHAGGLDYVPYDGYPAVLHKGERVQTAIEASSGRGGNAGPVIDNSINGLQVGNGVSRAEMFAAIKQAQGMQEQRMRRLSREGVFAT